MVYIENITTSQQVYIPRQVVNTGSSTNGGCINLEDYYTRDEVDELLAGVSGVSQEYVDDQDEATLDEAMAYTDGVLDDYYTKTEADNRFATIAELDAQIAAELARATAAETTLKNRIDNLFDYRTNTLYLNNEENNE